MTILSLRPRALLRQILIKFGKNSKINFLGATHQRIKLRETSIGADSM